MAVARVKAFYSFATKRSLRSQPRAEVLLGAGGPRNDLDLRRQPGIQNFAEVDLFWFFATWKIRKTSFAEQQ